ncbi:hypothetical protein [Paenibacillus rhizovicinus]|nr:hypothetical protein [Paenibacillus rhizovicinus]
MNDQASAGTNASAIKNDAGCGPQTETNGRNGCTVRIRRQFNVGE